MRPLSRNRRLAVICAACGSVVASSSSLLPHAPSGISDTARGVAFGLVIGTAAALITLSFGFLKRDRSACSRTSIPGA